jgi:hypothetical protein
VSSIAVIYKVMAHLGSLMPTGSAIVGLNTLRISNDEQCGVPPDLGHAQASAFGVRFDVI